MRLGSFDRSPTVISEDTYRKDRFRDHFLICELS